MQGVLKLMSDKDFNRKARKVREENRLIFAFSPALAPGASVALLAVSLTKNQETRLDFEKALPEQVLRLDLYMKNPIIVDRNDYSFCHHRRWRSRRHGRRP